MKILREACMVFAVFIVSLLFFYIAVLSIDSAVEFEESKDIVKSGGSVNVTNNFIYGDYSIEPIVKTFSCEIKSPEVKDGE